MEERESQSVASERDGGGDCGGCGGGDGSRSNAVRVLVVVAGCGTKTSGWGDCPPCGLLERATAVRTGRNSRPCFAWRLSRSWHAWLRLGRGSLRGSCVVGISAGCPVGYRASCHSRAVTRSGIVSVLDGTLWRAAVAA